MVKACACVELRHSRVVHECKVGQEAKQLEAHARTILLCASTERVQRFGLTAEASVCQKSDLIISYGVTFTKNS